MGALPTIPLPILSAALFDLDSDSWFSLGVQAQNDRELVAVVNEAMDLWQVIITTANPDLTGTLLELDVQGSGAGNQWNAQLLVSTSLAANGGLLPLTGFPIYTDPLDGGGFRRVLQYDAREATTAGDAGAAFTRDVMQAVLPPPMFRVPLVSTVSSSGNGNKHMVGCAFWELGAPIVPPALGGGAVAAAPTPDTPELYRVAVRDAIEAQGAIPVPPEYVPPKFQGNPLVEARKLLRRGETPAAAVARLRNPNP